MLEKDLPITLEVPEATEPHVLNYLNMLGEALRKYRKTHTVKRYRSAQSFADEKLSPYFSRGVERRSIAKAEAGDHKVSMGIYAAFLQEMDVWPEILRSITSTKTDDYRYVAIVMKELERKSQEKQKERINNLNKKFFNEIKR